MFDDYVAEPWEDEYEDGPELVDGQTWRELIPYRAANEQVIRESDVDFINRAIVEEHAAIYDRMVQADDMYDDRFNIADEAEAEWNARNIDRTIDLPWYESEHLIKRFGTDAKPEHVVEEIERMVGDMRKDAKADMSDLYESAFKLQTLRGRSLPSRCTGPGPRGGNRDIEFIRRSTKDVLGQPYDDWCKDAVSARIHAIGEKHMNKSTSVSGTVLGIDVTRPVQAPVAEKSLVNEKSVEKQADVSTGVQHDHEPEVLDIEPGWSDNRDMLDNPHYDEYKRSLRPGKVLESESAKRKRSSKRGQEIDGQTSFSDSSSSHVGEFDEDLREEDKKLAQQRNGTLPNGESDT